MGGSSGSSAARTFGAVVEPSERRHGGAEDGLAVGVAGAVAAEHVLGRRALHGVLSVQLDPEHRLREQERGHQTPVPLCIMGSESPRTRSWRTFSFQREGDAREPEETRESC